MQAAARQRDQETHDRGPDPFGYREKPAGPDLVFTHRTGSSSVCTYLPARVPADTNGTE